MDENLASLIELNNPESQAIQLSAILNVTADEVCPIKLCQSREFHTKWMTDEIRNKITLRDLLFKTYRQSLDQCQSSQIVNDHAF